MEMEWKWHGNGNGNGNGNGMEMAWKTHGKRVPFLARTVVGIQVSF